LAAKNLFDSAGANRQVEKDKKSSATPKTITRQRKPKAEAGIVKCDVRRFWIKQLLTVVVLELYSE
jgi:hypothetical protein